MTKAEKRVEIAKDVIKQIKAGRYKPVAGVYIGAVDNAGIDVVLNRSDTDSAKDVLKEAKICEVCAIGSAFISAIDKFNKINVREAFGVNIGYGCRNNYTGSAPTYHTYLHRFFSKKQLGIIESYFEGWDSAGNEYGSDPAVIFYDTYPDDTDRLLRIMRNIVRNKGTFVPPGVK